MSQVYKKIRVFLASPKDVEKEREAVESIIHRLNRTVADKRGVVLDLLRWEFAVPDSGDPQSVINKQFSEYDIFIGIMWKRFGTPTQNAGSGTEEEFNRAYQIWIQTHVSPHIMFYFCEHPIPFPTKVEEVEQLKKVIEFKERVSSLTLCFNYQGVDKFIELVTDNLTKILMNLSSDIPSKAENIQPPARDVEHSNNIDALNTKLDRLKWIVYAPVDFDPDNDTYPSEESLRKDLEILSAGPFNGIITFGSEKSLGLIPKLAKQSGIQGVIMGIFDLSNPDELQAAISSYHLVDGYCVGHRGVNTRYDVQELRRLLTIVREETKRPVSTTESLGDFIAYPTLAESVDWFFPDMHYYWHEGANPEEAIHDLLSKVKSFHDWFKGFPDRRIALKMISYPSSGGPGLTESAQARFFALLLRRIRDDTSIAGHIKFTFFAAFDNYWKTPERGWSRAELSTGLYTTERLPKPVLEVFKNPYGEI